MGVRGQNHALTRNIITVPPPPSRLNSGKPLPRPPHWNREDVLQPQKDLALNDAIWEGDSHDPFYVSDIHLPLSSQKSKFALTAQGVLGPDGKPIFSIDNLEPTGSNTPTNLNKGRSNSPSPSRSDKSKFVPIGTRPHSASMNSSERSDNDDTPEPERSSSARLPRRYEIARSEATSFERNVCARSLDSA